MSDKRKLGPARQLSLQQADGRVRPILKKQLSVEQLDAVAESRSGKAKVGDRPPPARLAWTESRQVSPAEPTPVEVKKCKEYKRPATAKLRAQPSVDKDSLLYTRQELAERLRKAWKDREDSKQNLDIFLTHNLPEEKEKPYADCTPDPGSKTWNETEILQNIHNKPRPKDSDSDYIPSTTASKPQEARTNLSVTIPSVAHNYRQIQQFDKAEIICQSKQADAEPESLGSEQNLNPKMVKQSSVNRPPDSSCRVQPARPMTAASKRDSFQKRTNTAFNGSFSITKEFRPSLARTLSVPVKNEKPKLIATKRRLKINRRKEREDDFSEDDTVASENSGSKKGSRCKSAPGGSELVTMVSLVSPAGSDAEDALDKKPDSKSRSTSPVKPDEPPKTVTLRKTVKQVSFQQSSIPTVRSFSASFQARRGSMAAALSNAIANIHHAQPEREKRVQGEGSPADARAPKRKLVRNNSTPLHNSGEIGQSQTLEKPNHVLKEPSEVPTSSDNNEGNPASSESETTNDDEALEPSDEEITSKEDESCDEPGTPKFATNKEKECWAMYKKMSDKGLPVSFDTILRGMLTPTEYRSIKKEVATN